mmetsp:Transcript_19446/g.43793  ORF Transcript_19446/g.43793 Transcript_19446/m.43793 type:complete len:86 (+) Transcript_19446:167-424(+)
MGRTTYDGPLEGHASAVHASRGATASASAKKKRSRSAFKAVAGTFGLHSEVVVRRLCARSKCKSGEAEAIHRSAAEEVVQGSSYL